MCGARRLEQIQITILIFLTENNSINYPKRWMYVGADTFNHRRKQKKKKKKKKTI